MIFCRKSILLISALLLALASFAQKSNVIDEVVWVVGDEAILRSDVEKVRMEYGNQVKGNPYCVIPEELAVQKLFLHQAVIDSIEVTDADVNNYVEQDINQKVLYAGSKEKLEEYMRMTMTQIREELFDMYKNQLTVREVRKRLTSDIKVTPAEVRRYFKDLPEDSLPLIPTQVEVQILVQQPKIPQEEIDRVKDKLRDYTERVNNGTTSFNALARLYSEDPGTARRGGELGFSGRGMLDPAFAAVAFNLTDPKKVSKIVESEFGFHIIQLIEKRGDKVNVRHILRKPVVSDEAIERSLARLDSIADDIRAEKFTFEDAASMISDDKDTRNNKGLMSNSNPQTGRITSRFQMQELPAEVAKVVDTMQVGQVSRAFQMINQRGKTVCVVAKLKHRVEGHKASIQEDFQTLKDVVVQKRQNERIHQWVVDKIKSVYTRLNDDYKDCQFEYEGWIK